MSNHDGFSARPRDGTIHRSLCDERSPDLHENRCQPVMKQHSNPHRHAIAMLLAAVALPATSSFAQDIQPLPVPAQTVPPPVVTSVPAPAPRVTPPPIVSVAPTPAPVAEAEQPAAAPPRRSAERPAPRPRVREVTPTAPVAAATVAAPAAAAPALTPVPAPAAPAAEIAPQPIEPVATGPVAADPVATVPAETGNAPWLWLVLGLAVIGAIAGLLAWRRRRETEYEGVEGYFDGEYEEPVPAPFVEPVPDAMTAAAPVVPAAALHVPAATRPDLVVAETHSTDPIGEIDKVSVGEPDSADIDAMVAASDAPVGRPWLELMMRPMRAGTNRDDAVVEFELTVSNAGDVPARDVRISTWMFAAGSAQESEMEQLLIDPPAGAKLSEVTLAPGDGTRIEAAIALPTDHGVDGSVLPVLVADARYTLPGGGEGRTSASFEIGLARGEAIEGFSTDRPTGMHEDIDARLHAEPQHA